jgi:hypothetical protein
MIDLRTENLISLVQAARLIPPGRNGKATHISTLMRWINPGARGVRLEAVRLGGRWLTSAAALQRFADRLTALETGSGPDQAATTIQAAEHAEEELARLGL